MVKGFTAPGFEGVKAAFEANFARKDVADRGAAFAVYRHGEPLVSLWGGERAPGVEWTEDTLVNVWSTTKGLTAISVAMLVDRGLLDYAAPVSRYWPEFGQQGKEAITVSQLLSHQGGLPGWTETTSIEDLFDWDVVTRRLSRQSPMWPPGTKNAYHAMTFGFLAGELIRRVTGRDVGAFMSEEIAVPLGADIFVGLPASMDDQVAPLIGQPPGTGPDLSSLPPEAVAAFSNPVISAVTPNSPAWRRAEIPAANGQCSAKGLATVYAALANKGAIGDHRLMSAETVDRLRQVQTDRVDLALGLALGWGNGVMLNIPGWFGPSVTAFGHFGYGGSFACADPENGVSMSYVMNQMGSEVLADPRASALVAATYQCLDRLGG